MSNFLVIDTSSKYLTVYAAKGGKEYLFYDPECAARHSQILMDRIDEAFGALSLTPDGCDFFGAVTGPGSFTGIRIGVSTVKGMALALGKPLLSITTFDLIAYNVEDKNFIAAADALRAHCYFAGYAESGKADLPPKYASLAEVEALGRAAYGFDDLPLKNYARLSPEKCVKKAVEALKGRAGGDMAPLYVRKSQAEEAKYGNQTVEI